MYDRTRTDIPKVSYTGVGNRIRVLTGVTGWRLAKYRDSWAEIIITPFNVIWRPQILFVLIFEAMLFGFSIGINVTNAVFLGTPPPVGFGWSQFAVAGCYGTPIVSLITG